MQKLLIICGQEGVGKSTLIKSLVEHLHHGAVIDAEDLVQVNPWEQNEKFENLVLDNAACIVNNFFKYNYERVVVGSVVRNRKELDLFKTKLTSQPEIYILNLIVSPEILDKRRKQREKEPFTKEFLDWLKTSAPQDATLKEDSEGNYTYIEINNSNFSVEETIRHLKNTTQNFFE
jgi:thymidylate kinase